MAHSCWIKTVEMGGLVDRENPNLAADYVDFVNAAGGLCKPPKGAERKVGELKQERSVHAVVRNENDGFVRVQF